MSRQRKLLVILAFLAIVVLAGVGFLISSLDSEAISENLESRLEASSGLQVRMPGTVELHFLPPGASFANITIADGEREILTAKRVRAGIALLPLLRREVRLSSLVLEEPILSLSRDTTEALIFGGTGTPTAYLGLGSVSVRNGAARYSDAAGTEMELEGLELELKKLARDEAGRISFTGDLRAGRLRIGRVEVLDLNGAVAGEGSLFRLEPLSSTPSTERSRYPVRISSSMASIWTVSSGIYGHPGISTWWTSASMPSQALWESWSGKESMWRAWPGRLVMRAGRTSKNSSSPGRCKTAWPGLKMSPSAPGKTVWLSQGPSISPVGATTA